METKRSSSVYWIVGGGITATLCCLGCVVVVGGLGLITFWGAVQMAEPQPPFFDTPRPTATSVVLPAEPTPVPPQAEATQRLLSSVVVPVADPVALAMRFFGRRNIPRVVAQSADPIPLGTVQSFWASNVDTSENFQLEAELVYGSEHVYFWIQSGLDYDLNDVRDIVEEFEEKAYLTNRAFFGSEWSPGVDGDGHIYMLYAEGLGSWVAGYFSSNDEYSPLVHEYSNGHEMFYLSAENVTLDDSYMAGVLAHEFQHMIHWYRDANEETWMNEGFSELAAHLNGYDLGGFDSLYAMDPDLPLTYWPSEDETRGAHYGQAFLFLSYFLDRFGPDATQALVGNAANGLESIEQSLASSEALDPETGRPITAEDLFRDWAVAMLLQDESVGDGRYRLASYSRAPAVEFSDQFDECPVGELGRQVNQFGVDYVRFRCPGDYELSFTGVTLAQVVPADPHSGDYAFWSNRGDESDMTLTRAFSFPETDQPIVLEYWTWYDLEEDYDYVYVEVSQDDGETWEIISTPSGTAEDPSGNSYGWGYNGRSGLFEAGWIQEQLDLSAFAGEDVLLRFEYITDAAVNGEGFLIDDIAIGALGYHEDFEVDEGGWEGAGFVRLFNRLPQSYRLVLVERGSEVRVREINVAADQSASAELHLGQEYDEAILLVLGTTRHTWLPATYGYEVLR
ncbi:MAG TPA: hypothetical protein VJ123_07340 [Anaerolineales bacterium]|nr:hypothetical protein [Anaerolineales bacterium]